MNEKSWGKPIVINGWGGSRPYTERGGYVPTWPAPDDRLPRPPKPEEKQI